MTRHGRLAERGAVASLLALATLLACASEQQSDIAEDDETTGGSLKGLGGFVNGTAGLPISGSATKPSGGTAATTPSAAGAGGSISGGTAVGGSSASAGNGGRGGNSSSAGAAGSNNAGGAGGLNQPAHCDDTNAIALGTMSSNITVASNACLKMTLPADQTWIKKITLQPDSGMYPLPYSWSNCGTNSSGVFTANYANVTLDPVTAQCPIFVKLGGTTRMINVQWWGG